MSNEIKKDIDNKAEFAKELEALSKKHNCTIVAYPNWIRERDGAFVLAINMVVEDIKK